MATAVFPATVWIICTLLKSEIDEVISLVTVGVGEEFELDIGGFSLAYMEANEKLNKFSRIFQRSLTAYIVFGTYSILVTPMNSGPFLFMMNILCILLIGAELGTLAFPSASAELLRIAIDKLRPRKSQFSEFLLLKNDIQRGIGAVNLYMHRMTQPGATSFLLRFAALLVVVKQTMTNNYSGMFGLFP